MDGQARRRVRHSRPRAAGHGRPRRAGAPEARAPRRLGADPVGAPRHRDQARGPPRRRVRLHDQAVLLRRARRADPDPPACAGRLGGRQRGAAGGRDRARHAGPVGRHRQRPRAADRSRVPAPRVHDAQPRPHDLAAAPAVGGVGLRTSRTRTSSTSRCAGCARRSATTASRPSDRPATGSPSDRAPRHRVVGVRQPGRVAPGDLLRPLPDRHGRARRHAGADPVPLRLRGRHDRLRPAPVAAPRRRCSPRSRRGSRPAASRSTT